MLTQDEFHSIIGKNIRKKRIEMGLTQEKMAERLGISTSHYSNLENGNRGVNIYTLKIIAETLGVGIDYLTSDGDLTNRLNNINILLQKVPDEKIQSIEKMIAILANEIIGSK